VVCHDLAEHFAAQRDRRPARRIALLVEHDARPQRTVARHHARNPTVVRLAALAQATSVVDHHDGSRLYDSRLEHGKLFSAISTEQLDVARHAVEMDAKVAVDIVDVNMTLVSVDPDVEESAVAVHLKHRAPEDVMNNEIARVPEASDVDRGVGAVDA